MRNKFLFSFVLMGALLAAPLVHADEASLGGRGGNLFVEANESVQMQSETIMIQVFPSNPGGVDWNNHDLYSQKSFRGYSEYEVIYNFENLTDEPVEVLMGFPQENRWDPGAKLHDFEASVSTGVNQWEALPVEFVDSNSSIRKSGVEYPSHSWYTTPFVFEPGKTQIKNRYWNLASAYKMGSRWIQYTLDTGASWAEDIESVDVEVHFMGTLMPYDVTRLNPSEGFEYDELKNALYWHFDDLEPTKEDNLSIFYVDPNEANEMCLWDGMDNTNASSYIPPLNDEVVYYPCAAYDLNVRSAWVEDAEGGIGEYIDIRLRDTIEYSFVELYTGYAWSAETWEENGRPRALDLMYFTEEAYESGDAEAYGLSHRIDLEDLDTYQYIDLPERVKGSEYSMVRVSIADYVRGSVYPDDVAISELRFYGEVIPGSDGGNWEEDFDYRIEQKVLEEQTVEVPIVELQMQNEEQELKMSALSSLKRYLKNVLLGVFLALPFVLVHLMKRRKNKAL